MAKYGLLVIVAFLIGGCASQSTATKSAESVRILQCTEGWGCVSGPEGTPLPALTESGHTQTDPSSQLTNSSEGAAQQQILVSEIQGNVSMQETPNGNYVPAQSGMLIPLGVLIQTDSSSRARLTLQPEGTAINIGINSSIAVKSLSSSGDGKSELHVTFDVGKIWILPHGGRIAIKTEIGTASSDGSPLGVSYDPSAANLEASCLEGICSLKNDEGEVILTSGMMAVITAGHLPYSSEQMSGDVLQEWVNENLDLKDYFGGKIPGWLPNPDSSSGN